MSAIRGISMMTVLPWRSVQVPIALASSSWAIAAFAAATDSSNVASIASALAGSFTAEVCAAAWPCRSRRAGASPRSSAGGPRCAARAARASRTSRGASRTACPPGTRESTLRVVELSRSNSMRSGSIIRMGLSPSPVSPLVIFKESSPRLPPESSRQNQPLQERGRRETGLTILGEHDLGDRVDRVEADVVEQLERAHRVRAPELHAGVDVLERADALLVRADRVEEVRHEEAVHDEARVVPAGDGLLAERRGRTPSRRRPSRPTSRGRARPPRAS